METLSSYREHWQLNPAVTFLNHGSFGATPSVVLEAQRKLRDELESDPILFLAPERELEPKLDEVRELIAEIVNADSQDIAFVRNSTDGVNAVFRSFPFERDDEVIITNLGYNACNNAVRFSAERYGAKVRVAEIPFPIESPEQAVIAVEKVISPKTKLILVDHITSGTGLVLPVKQIIELARRHGTRIMIDGAHAPGMIDMDIKDLAPDYYTANHHKWLCGPKVSGMLWVAPQHQHEVRPSVISHGYNKTRPNRSRFLSEFDWCGTWDATTLLAVGPSIKFLSKLLPGGLSELMTHNQNLAIDARKILCDSLNVYPPAPQEMLGTLVTLPVPEKIASHTMSAESFQNWLFENHKIEVPVNRNDQTNQLWFRISAQIYNHAAEYQKLADAINAWSA